MRNKVLPRSQSGLRRPVFSVGPVWRSPFQDGAYPITTPYIVGVHEAYDHGTPTGTPKLAMRVGVVVYAGWDDRFPVGSANGRGIYVDVLHEDGWLSRQMHFSQVMVPVGEWVQQGRWLGLSGNTGLSTGPHSHDAVFDANGRGIDWMALV